MPTATTLQDCPVDVQVIVKAIRATAKPVDCNTADALRRIVTRHYTTLWEPGRNYRPSMSRGDADYWDAEMHRAIVFCGLGDYGLAADVLKALERWMIRTTG
jgi:hypothetical protein